MVHWSLGLLAVTIGALGHAAARRWPCAGRVLLPLLLAALCARAVFDARPDWEWALLPWPGYAFVQPLTLHLLAVPFFAVAAARLPVRWNRAVVAALGFAVLGHGLYRYAPLALAERHGDERVAGPDHHLRQSRIYTCGPAACVSALSYFGVVRTERQMAELCLCRRGGSRLFDLYRGLCLALHDAPFAVSIERLDVHELLADEHVIVTSNASGSHAICVATRAGVAVVHDPLRKAPLTVDADELQRTLRGPCIVLQKTSPAAPRPH